MSRGMTLAAVALAVAFAFGTGWIVGRSGVEPESPAASPTMTPPAPSPVAKEGPLPRVIENLRRERDEAVADAVRARAEHESPKQDAADLLSKGLREQLDDTTIAAVRDRAARTRKSLLAAADGAEFTAAAQMEREIRAERAEREDRMRGGTIAFLKGLKDHWTPQWELVRSPELFGALFERRTDGGVLDGGTMDCKVRPADGATIRYAAGRFALDVDAMSAWTPFPKDLAIQGAGMDTSLLVASDRFRISDPVHCLTFRDVTIDASRAHFADLRGAYTLRLERCRVVGFDNGAGGSSMLDGSPGAFLATDCRFEAGFGGSWDGSLFDVRGAFVARLQNCDVVGPFREIFERSSSASQVFVGCRFTRMNDDVRNAVERNADGVQFVDCTFEYLTADAREPTAPRALTDINPAWGGTKAR